MISEKIFGLLVPAASRFFQQLVAVAAVLGIYH
jgi:hypothetical protein